MFIRISQLLYKAMLDSYISVLFCISNQMLVKILKINKIYGEKLKYKLQKKSIISQLQRYFKSPLSHSMMTYMWFLTRVSLKTVWRHRKQQASYY